jgi:DNA-binding NarL/FixJ family response regulator
MRMPHAWGFSFMRSNSDLEAGASGCVIKGMPAAILLDALRRVQTGNRYLPRPVEKILEARIPDSDLRPVSAKFWL